MSDAQVAVKIHDADGARWITLDRPPLNVLDVPTIEALSANFLASKQPWRIKVAPHCDWFAEEAENYAFPDREDKNAGENPVDYRNHLMDATRYLIKSGRDRMRTKPVEATPEPVYGIFSSDGWMA